MLRFQNGAVLRPNSHTSAVKCCYNCAWNDKEPCLTTPFSSIDLRNWSQLFCPTFTGFPIDWCIYGIPTWCRCPYYLSCWSSCCTVGVMYATCHVVRNRPSTSSTKQCILDACDQYCDTDFGVSVCEGKFTIFHKVSTIKSRWVSLLMLIYRYEWFYKRLECAKS